MDVERDSGDDNACTTKELASPAGVRVSEQTLSARKTRSIEQSFCTTAEMPTSAALLPAVRKLTPFAARENSCTEGGTAQPPRTAINEAMARTRNAVTVEISLSPNPLKAAPWPEKPLESNGLALIHH